MAYNNNREYNQRPPVMKQDITPLIPQIQEMTEGKWKEAEIRLIWSQQPNEMSPDDFLRMMYIAQKRGLDPLLRQIYASSRWNSKGNGGQGCYTTTIESTIDGFRLACDLTGEVDGMTEPRFQYVDVEGGFRQLYSCSITLFRKGVQHGFTATAFFAEYVQTNSSGQPANLWAKMPHTMLAKCCEALVRRMAFPAALSGIYAKEEMMQADSEAPLDPTYIPRETAAGNAPQLPAQEVPNGPAPVVTVPAPAEAAPAKRQTRGRAPAKPAEAPAPPQAPIAPPQAPQTAPAPPQAPPCPAAPPPNQMLPDSPEKFICSDTGQPITDWTDPNTNQRFDRDWIYEYSLRNMGRPLCAERLLAIKQERDAAPPANVVAAQAAQILNGGVNGHA